MDSTECKTGTESQDSGSPASVGTGSGVSTFDKASLILPGSSSSTMSPKLTPTSKGVINAKKRLRAFSIQKKTAITSVPVPKPISTGNTTVIIGKLNSVKVTPKITPKVIIDDPTGDQKKPPKPPKPGDRNTQDYMDQQKKTLAEIEDMKRMMELVDLGIPLGLIGPSSQYDKAMPTKAMPPIKTFLECDSCVYLPIVRDWLLPWERKRHKYRIHSAYKSQLDKIILEAKKARAEGKQFKFDYNKLLPGYDNPFQRKRDEHDTDKSGDRSYRGKSKDRRMSKFDSRFSYKKESKPKYRVGDRGKHMENRKYYEGREDKKEKVVKVEKNPKEQNETDVNLGDYLVCDSWSLDNEDKSVLSPKVEDSVRSRDTPNAREKISAELLEELNETENVTKMEKLKPVIDSFKYEIDPNEEDAMDIYDDVSSSNKYPKPDTKKAELYDSPNTFKLTDDNSVSKDGSDVNDDKFLQSVINEIKEDDICDVRGHDKSLVEYDESPKDNESQSDTRGSVTPELKSLNSSAMSDYSEGYKSLESGYKSTESGYKSTDSGYKAKDNAENRFRLSLEREVQGNISKSTVNSLETWSFVLKICQPLLFRHDKDKCYKETRTLPKLWFTENPRRCCCVKDRSIVYDELEMFKMNLVDRVYGCDQIPDAPFPKSRSWYPRSEYSAVKLTSNDDWETEENQVEPKRVDRRSMTPQRSEEIYLDREYQKFMQALSDASEQKADNSRSTTPIVMEAKAANIEEKRKAKKRYSSEGWSQESDLDENEDKSKRIKIDKEKQRKRKHSTSTSSVTTSSDEQMKKKKSTKKRQSKKSKISKHSRMGKKYRKKLKEKQKKKKRLMKLAQNTDVEEDDDEKGIRKKEKLKRRKQQKSIRNKQKKRKSKAKSSSSSVTSSTSETSSTETDSEVEKKSKKTKKHEEGKKKKRKKSTSESQSEELFDVNILNNIKTERITDDEKQISPRKKPREIINVKELENDFVGNNIHIKKEVEDKKIIESNRTVESNNNKEDTLLQVQDNEKEQENETPVNVDLEKCIEQKTNEQQKETQEVDMFQNDTGIQKNEVLEDKKVDAIVQQGDSAQVTSQVAPLDDTSQSSSQDSTKIELYEKDETHLRPPSQNSNYNFTDVIANQTSYQKDLDAEEKFHEGYEPENYEMYEQMAMAYQNDADTQAKCDGGGGGVERRIETVVRGRARGEIKCDWRAGDRPLLAHHRPSRWGLKPGEVNIVLTGGHGAGDAFPMEPAAEPQQVYKIQSLANRTDNCSISYDEAYMDTYGALDRLQYGDCFAEQAPAEPESAPPPAVSSLDERISQALQDSVLRELAKEIDDTEADKDGSDKGILVTKPMAASEAARSCKRVSFADGYKPGQDSDVEEPPVKKRKRARRVGCAWPCPASHADHVPLWDALPPPPPPPGSPPRPLLHPPQRHRLLAKYDPGLPLSNFMPPEPPPGILTF